MHQNQCGLNKQFFFLVVFPFLCLSCNQDAPKNPDAFNIVYPYGFDSIKFPDDNRLTTARVELGKKIFFDTQFSADKKISCATCHKPQFAFADTVTLHRGAHGALAFRNTPGIINIGYHPYLDYDGGVPNLEMQVFVPFDGETEMQSNLVDAAAMMEKDKVYLDLAQKAYQRKPDPYVITRALGAYQRSLVSVGSRYDQYQQTKKGMNAEEIKGMELFFSARTGCNNCHSGFLFTDFSFQDLGLPNHTNDTGRARVSFNPRDAGKFKTPGLRNVALTRPYMHDGSIKTLEEVMAFYDRGGGHSRNKTPLVKPLGLTAGEKKAIIAFLHTLTDTTFLKR